MSIRSFSQIPILSRIYFTSPRTTPTSTLISLKGTSLRTITTSSSRMATNAKSPEGQAISEVSKQEGGTFKGSTAAQMQSQITKQRNAENSGQTNQGQSNDPNANLAPAEQSQLDREANFAEAADKVGAKMANDPGSVTKEDGDLLHSRETKAHGITEKGGIASQAQSQAAANEGNKA